MKRRISHRSVIGTILDAFTRWKVVAGVSRETLAIEVVEVHERLGLDRVTGVRFSDNPDRIQRAKNDADRLFRWLDEGRDNGHLPANMLPGLLASLPVDLRVVAANEILAPAGLAVRLLPDGSGQDRRGMLLALLKESGEAGVALAGLGDGSSVSGLRRAIAEIEEARAAADEALRGLHADLVVAQRESGVCCG
ncbi:hypothetical protein LH462_11075 [Laribacter hongkongensis]|uniref:Bacterial toxin YdaT domain-containing protein n=1 Tax=Laribacter hongkongensis TaxID=168471 RepID=A0ABD4SVK9_9NEIS|nr:hypothetical protein [Laribacter hongkongensis]MCG9026730.1 hypothetical protein [Laribacter hongkongensis]MCG9101614.1 hypothetical protein [Laribacter hongkongensis]MCG9104260.1 hypothetical protein [Laribacter hongkongensis]MCG9113493.1 hypothetical protein [Laribacter hongkongensis]MCG9119231.1 hypothetical protein [Laribacter hongkongensis]